MIEEKERNSMEKNEIIWLVSQKYNDRYFKFKNQRERHSQLPSSWKSKIHR
jgi:hypothetical protein